jgi:hypothetical protein
MSHDGHYEGADNDLSIVLHRDGTAVVEEDSYAVMIWRGKYVVDDEGRIVIMPSETSRWLPMPWSIDKGKLVIKPPPKAQVFEAARKAGIAESELTDEAYEESYQQWPLRQIEPGKQSGASEPCRHPLGT